MSYFGISGIRSPYSSLSSVYARNRVRTSPTRRVNTSPRTSSARYNSTVGNSSYNPYSYRTSAIYDSLNRLQGIKNSALNLSDSASRFLNTGKTDLFAQKEVTAADGTKQSVYDTDAICNAVKDFVDYYNDALDSVSGDSTRNVQTASDTLIRTTSSVKKSLEEIGITVERGGKLSLDEKILKSADMEKVKELMGGSYAKSAASAASRMYNAANTAAVSQAASARRAMSGYSLFGGYGNYGSYLNGLSGFNSLGGYPGFGSYSGANSFDLGSFFNRYF